MAKASSKKSAPAPAPVKTAGTHKTFTDEDLDGLDFEDMEGSFHSSDDDMRGAGSSGSEEDGSEEEEDSESESDEDGAPEEETLAEGKAGEQERRQEAERVLQEAKQARRLASTKRALASQSKLAPPPPPTRKPRTPKASTSSTTTATGGPSYLPDELFESAAADRESRLAKEAEEEMEKAAGLKSGEEKKRKRYERDDRLDIGSTSIRHLPTASHLTPHLLAPAPTPRRVKKFLKNAQQIKTAAQAQSEQGKGKLAITAGSGGRGWVRKEAHLTISQKKKGPSVGFVTGRLA